MPYCDISDRAQMSKTIMSGCRETRNDHKLDVPLFKTAAGQKTFLYKTTTLWNNIDPALKLCNSFLSFKVKLKH